MTINCPSCGVESPADARFCSECGASITRRCPSCGSEAAPGARFCSGCGTSLAPSQETPARAVEERKVVSVLFTDLEGFTARTEGSDPEDIRARLTLYHRTVREQVEAHGGRVEKLMGDGVFAVFGVPAAHEDDPERAVRAALRLQEAIRDLNEDQPDLGLAVRAAVTTGEAIVQLDATDRDRETIIGDVVNTAARLQEVAPPRRVLVDERTFLAARRDIVFEDREAVDLKGKSGATAIWLATGTRARQGVGVEERHRGPFVGRASELAVLVDSLDRTIATDTTNLITVMGEPGAGKSRLLYEFKSLLDARPGTVWWKRGRCLPYGEGITFWALGEIVKAQAGILESDGEADADRKLRHAVTALMADSAQIEWVLARLSLLAGGAAGAGQVEQGELFSAWTRFFEAMARRHPLVMVVEDAHWADDSLLDFLEHVARWAVDVPIMIVAAARPELLASRPGWGGGVRNAATISLAPLGNADAATLLAALLDRAVLPAEVQQQILERAGGNPLYVTELVRLAADSGLLEGGVIAALSLPDSVQSIIAARLDLLGAGEKAVLQAASVVGKVFWSGAISALRPTANASAMLRELVRRELIRPIRDPSMRGQEEYGFVHGLVRDVAYGQIARDDRAAMHQAAAAWIEAVSGERGVDAAELLAYHLGEALEATPTPDADLRGRAFRALMQAGERARGLDPTRAAAYYLSAAEAAVDDHDRAMALLEAGQRSQHDIDRAQGWVEEARRLFVAAGDVEGEASALDALSSRAWWRGDTERSMGLVEQAVRLLEDRPGSQAKARVLATQAARLSIRGLDAEAVAVADAAASVVSEFGTAEDQVRLLSTRGAAATRIGLDDDGIDQMRTAVEMADDRNLTVPAVTIRNNLGTLIHQLRSPQDAVPYLDEAIALLEARGLPTSLDWMRFTKSEILVWTGDWEESMALSRQVVRDDDARGGSQAGRGARGNIAFIEHYQCVTKPTVAWSDLVESGRAIKDQQVMAPTFGIATTVAYDSGDEAGAVAFADEYAEVTVDVYRAWFLPWVTGPLARLGEADRIQRLLEGAVVVGSHAEVGQARAEGHLAEARGDIGAAAERYLAAVEIADRYRRPVDATLARVDAARALVGDPRSAAIVAAAREAAQRMGAERVLATLDEIEGAGSDQAAGA